MKQEDHSLQSGKDRQFCAKPFSASSRRWKFQEKGGFSSKDISMSLRVSDPDLWEGVWKSHMKISPSSPMLKVPPLP